MSGDENGATPFLEGAFRPLFLGLLGASFLLGLALLILALRARPRTTLVKFFIVTGASTLGLALFSVLHNAFYALGELATEGSILQGALGVLEAGFFVVSVIACPIGFLVGVVGGIVALVRRRRRGQD